jgi:peroxiredoxin
MVTVRNATWDRLAWLGLALWLTGAAPESVVPPTLPGPDGRPVALKAPDGGAAAVVFYSSECPISNAYSTTLNRLVAETPAARVRLVGVCVDPDLTDADVIAHARDFGLKFPVVRDRRGALAARLGATVTPEAFVIDAAGRVRYHGRIDDQFAARGKANANSETHELRDAIDAVLCPIPDPPPTTDARAGKNE